MNFCEGKYTTTWYFIREIYRIHKLSISRNSMDENYRKMDIVYRKLQQLFLRTMQHLFHNVSKMSLLSNSNDVQSNDVIQSSDGTVSLHPPSSSFTAEETNFSSMTTTELTKPSMADGPREPFEIMAKAVEEKNKEVVLGLESLARVYAPSSSLHIGLSSIERDSFLSSTNESKNCVDLSSLEGNSDPMNVLCDAIKQQTSEDGVQFVFTEYASVNGRQFGFPAFQFHNKRGLKLLGFYNVLRGDSSEMIVIDEELKAKVGRIWNSHSCKISREGFFEVSSLFVRRS
jgi:hypothetical protein